MSLDAAAPIRLPTTGLLRLGELYGSSAACLLAEAASGAPAPLLVVAATGREADQFLAETAFFAPEELTRLPDRSPQALQGSP